LGSTVPDASTVEEQTPQPSQAPERWFADQVHRYDGTLKGYLRGAFPTVQDVDDIVQESYLRIWRIRATENIRSAKGLLFAIARHITIDLIRRERSSPVIRVTDLSALSVFDDGPNPADVACTSEELAFLADAIARLPARCREIVILRKIKRVPQKEIARLLGISEQTVQVQVLRGIKRCEKFLLKGGIRGLDGYTK
jgi:RNA polymerase sigma-70 factor (ECF subfamily)